MTFMNIAGYESEKKNLEEICYLIKHYDKITRFGLHLPTGVLMLGRPGVGKTALAEALIEEAGVPCIRVNHSEITSTTSLSDLLRTSFEKAARVQPSILFLDEMEKLLGSMSYKNGTEVGILINAIQCYHKPGVLLLATANMESYIPDSLRRSGRFDRVFNIPLPSLADRTEIILHYLNYQTLDESFTIDDFARLTEGLSGADIQCIINEIGIRNLFDGRRKISRLDVSKAIADKLLKGVSRAATEQSEALTITAYHEAGHLATALLLAPDIIEYATIRAQGEASGFACTSFPVRSKNAALTRAKFRLSGRCAERLFFPDDIFFGSLSDYREAFRTIDDLVTTEQCYGVEFNRLALGGRASNEKLRACEQKIEEIVRECEAETMALLSKHKPLIETLATLLLQKYTLQKEEILEVYREYEKQNALGA